MMRDDGDEVLDTSGVGQRQWQWQWQWQRIDVDDKRAASNKRNQRCCMRIQSTLKHPLALYLSSL
jgi:hypothetical protein